MLILNTSYFYTYIRERFKQKPKCFSFQASSPASVATTFTSTRRKVSTVCATKPVTSACGRRKAANIRGSTRLWCPSCASSSSNTIKNSTNWSARILAGRRSKRSKESLVGCAELEAVRQTIFGSSIFAAFWFCFWELPPIYLFFATRIQSNNRTNEGERL